MTRIAMILGHDLLIPNEDTRVYREATSLVNFGFEVTVFCWARRMDKYETKWEDERNGIKVVRIFEDLEGGFLSKVRSYKSSNRIRTDRRGLCSRSWMVNNGRGKLEI